MRLPVHYQVTRPGQAGAGGGYRQSTQTSPEPSNRLTGFTQVQAVHIRSAHIVPDRSRDFGRNALRSGRMSPGGPI